jgi:hypothetical protein
MPNELLKSYQPSLRERAANALNQYWYGDDRAGQDKANALLNVLDYTPVGAGFALHEAGRQGAQGNALGAGVNLAMAAAPGPNFRVRIGNHVAVDSGSYFPNGRPAYQWHEGIVGTKFTKKEAEALVRYLKKNGDPNAQPIIEPYIEPE